MSPRAMNTQVTFQFLQFAFQRFRLRVLADVRGLRFSDDA